MAERADISGELERLRGFDRGIRRSQKVGVVTGGRSSERAISLRTGEGFERALRDLGYQPRVYDIPRDLAKIAQERPDAVLLGIHGGAGENGVLQGFLEALRIAYTGSGVLASALAMDKGRAKAVLASERVATPAGIRLSGRGALDFEAINAELDLRGLQLPLVVKPNDEGSSVGVFICQEETEFAEALESLWGRPVIEGSASILVERYLDGPEYTVGFFDEVCLGAIEVTPEAGFYDYQAKYESDKTRYEPVLDEALKLRLEAIGREAYTALGCRGVARVDVKAHRRADAPDQGDRADHYHENFELYVLEVNTIPGMTATSLIPKLAAERGIGFEEFSELMLAKACCDFERSDEETSAL